MITQDGTWVLEDGVSSSRQISVARIFLPFGCYFSTNWTRTRENSRVNPLYRRTERGALDPLSPTKKRRESALRFYRRSFVPPRVPTFSAMREPFHWLIVGETALRIKKTSKLTIQAACARMQINSCLDVCIRCRLRNNMKSSSLAGYCFLYNCLSCLHRANSQLLCCPIFPAFCFWRNKKGLFIVLTIIPVLLYIFFIGD